MQTITPQQYLNDQIIAIKQAAKDYVVTVITADINGDAYRIIVDGNHSFAAAIADGVEPEYVEATAQINDAVGLTGDRLLDALHHGCDYIYADTRETVW